MTAYREIRTASDVTDAHVQEATDMREGLYGGAPLPWDEVLARLENDSDDDWGSDLNSPAIAELKRRVRRELSGG